MIKDDVLAGLQAEETVAQRSKEPGDARSFIVGLGGSAGAIPALRRFLAQVPDKPGMAFVVLVHLDPAQDSRLAEVLQPHSRMPVTRVTSTVRVEPDHVYVIPPGRALRMLDDHLLLVALPAEHAGRHAIDLFFRTLADTHGPRGVAVVLSGADSDGALGLKRIKERGGLTIAQLPEEAEHATMPAAAIATGMVDWVLPVAEMAGRVADYVRRERHMALPTGPAGQPPPTPTNAELEAQLREVLSYLRTRTGRDFVNYKRATILRRIGRRMLVNGVSELSEYLDCLRTRPGEASALLQDLLISVTNFFRDRECFDLLETHVASLFADKTAGGTVRVWVPACATGEEAYSIAIVLAEHARTLDAPPTVQIFATDLDEESIRVAREGVYPATIEADVSEERLRRYFTKEHRGYRVRRELREQLMFAEHDLLKDSPFSRLDFVSCRNLLIYLNREAQARAFETLHFSLLPGGLLFLGASESVEDGNPLFRVIDKKCRLYAPRAVPRTSLPVPMGQSVLARALELQESARSSPVVANIEFPADLASSRPPINANGRAVSWAEMHFKLLEAIAPPSILVDSQHDIMHLSPTAGRFLRYGGGEPSRNLLQAVHQSLRLDLRAALVRVAQTGERVETAPLRVDLGGAVSMLRLTVSPLESIAPGLLLVLIESALPEAAAGLPAPADERGVDPLAHLLDRELERLKSHLRDTVEQYETSTEELKASNEELQAMNEELRSATEELETSREELQSINEELTTVNQELKAKVDELGHSNSDMQNLMDATAIATLFLDRELRITRYTPSAVALFNLIPSDVGRPLSHLSNKLDYAMLNEDGHRVLEGLIPVEREVRDALDHWYLLRMRPYRTVDDRIAGIVLTLVDITERKDAEGALRRSEERLRLVMDNALDYAIFSMNLEGCIVSWNSGAQRLLGYSETEVLNQGCDMLFTEEDRQAGVPAEELRRALAEGRASDDRVLRRKDGRRFWASGSITPMRDAEHGVVGFVKILRDQTAARDAEDAIAAGRMHLLQALEDKEHARAELEAADVAKDRFLAVLSHELRNPLAAIAGASAVLDSGEPGDAQALAQVRRILSQQVGTMRSLLDDLLDISRLRLGRFELKRANATLSSIVESAVDAARVDIERCHHELQVRLPQEPVTLNVDATRISQVICNLLVNAAKYTPVGGRIEVAAKAQKEEVEITVTDTGRGLDEEALMSLFEMFWRAPDLDTSTGPSMGIGLSLARTIVALHHGTIEADSDGPGRGSRFVVTLPIIQEHSADEPAGPASDVAPADRDTVQEAPRPSLRILLADDNEDVTWTQASVLEAHGFDVRTAANGEQALEVLSGFQPDVALLDIAMGGLSGLDLARRIRDLPGGRDVLLLAATGWGSDADRENSLAAGFDEHLVKPINMEWLIRHLAESVPKSSR